MKVPALNLITVIIKFQHEVWKRQPNYNKTFPLLPAAEIGHVI